MKVEGAIIDEDGSSADLHSSHALSAQHLKLSGARILVVDCDAEAASEVQRLLGELYAVTAVGDGPSAQRALGEQGADLVLLGASLGPEAGPQLLKSLRALPATTATPVVVIIDRSREFEAWEDEFAGADDFLTRPFTARQLASRVGAHLALVRLRREAAERERIEAALRESEQRYRLVAEAANDYIWDWDVQTGEVVRNDGPQRVFGYGREDVGTNVSWGQEKVHPDDRDPIGASMWAALNGEEDSWRGEYRFRRADGRYADVLTRSHIVRDSQGKPLRMISSTMDLTERKRSGEALRDSERRFAMFMQHLPGLAWIKDARGRYVFVNGAAARAFQKPEDQLYGRSDQEIFPTETARQFSENDAQALSGMAAVETIETLDQDDGLHHSLVSKFPIPGVDGAATLIGGIAIDVTERIKAEQALRNSEERFRAVTMNAPVAIFIKDVDGRYTLCNPLASKALGRPQGAAGLTDHDLLPREAADKLRQHDLEVLSSNRVLESEESVPLAGVDRHYLSVKFPLHNSAGETVGIAGVAVDVTDRKQAQQALRESERRLLLATQAGKVGVWAWELESNRVSWSESLQNILGIRAEDLGTAVDSFESLVHPDDRGRVETALREAIEQDVPLEIEFRAVRPDGQYVWLFSNAAVVRDGQRAVRMLGATLDVTDRQQGEMALRESEERFRTLANHAPVGIFQSDPSGGTVYVNSAWCEMTGLSPEQSRGDGWAQAIHPEDRDRALAGWRNAVAKMAPSADEFRFLRPDGVVTWLQGNAVPLRDAAGQCIGYIGTVADVTARKEGEAALRNSERMYRAIGESIDYGIWVCDAEGKNIYSSESFLKLVGRTQQECSNLGWLDVLHPDDADQTIAAWKQCVATGAAWDVEHRFRGVDGKWHPVLARGVPVRNDREEIIAWAGINLDISQLKGVESDLRESEARFRNMADGAPVLIWVHGIGGCQYVNREFLHFVGGTLADVQGTNWTQFLHPDDAQGYLASFQDAFQHHRPIDAQFRFRRADGEHRWLSATGAPRFRPDGAFLGYVGCSVDITDIKASEAALREADRRKDDFLAMLGHELRNPLAGIVTGAQVLSMLELDSEAAEMQAVIARQSSYMSRIVDDLLDVSRIARGKLRLRHQYANLRQILQDTVDDYRKSRPLDQCELQAHIPPSDVWVWADAARLTQAFSNILHNSFKFSDGPNVISIAMTTDPARFEATVTVGDRGIGMTRETIDRIFEPFNQADNSLERSRGGLGLGLALTRGLVHLHGGTVSAQSEGLGRGATFTITLPCVTPPKTKAATASPAGAQSERILIIDDRRDAILPLNRMLQMDGHTVAIALDGPSGLARAAEFLPNVVLCDIGLPGEMNGYAVCRALRALPQTATAYLVAVTGYGHEEARRHAKEAGFDYHLTKPLSKEQLRDLLSSRPTF